MEYSESKADLRRIKQAQADLSDHYGEAAYWDSRYKEWAPHPYDWLLKFSGHFVFR